ncbi:hypothetical protein ACFU8W_38630 [Streptomyces sp. NPDC057565]|uniref:hypothetical protein n=1 Tax=Streptomyces sp. NPDC057565 TaxID=3346169 RepID=UPI0036B86BF2
MAHRTRGFTSHTYDVKAVHSVDEDRLTITYSDAAHAERQSISLRSGLPATPAARQLLVGMARSLKVYGDGDWESAYMLNGLASACTRLLVRLEARGVRDFASPVVTLPILRDALDDFGDTTKRVLNKLLARVLRVHHPRGQALAQALSNTTYMVRESRTEPYEDEVADAIEASARGIFAGAFIAQRSVLADFGVDVSKRAWLSVRAADLIADARARYPALSERVPRPIEPRAKLIAWTLLNPRAVVTWGRKRFVGMLGPTMLEIGRALHPPIEVLTAALILQCLADNEGLNLATILRTEPSDLFYTGSRHGVLQTAKARSHSEDDVPVRIESMYSLGGVVETLTGLTRFSRHFRAESLVGDEDVPEIVNKLYIEHRDDPGKAEILPTTRIHHGWRNSAFDEHWPNPDVDRRGLGLRFRALRNKSLERAIAKDPNADVQGHSERTRLHYLANVLPDHTLTKLAGEAQNDWLDAALAKYAPVSVATSGPAQELAQVEPEKLLDLQASVCSNGGNDPDEPERPCSLGLAACFTCPCGYRTADNVPGLLATVAFTEIIRDNDPDEWENGEASVLHHYASKSLEKFSRSLVNTVRAKVDLTRHIVIINGLYTELRR